MDCELLGGSPVSAFHFEVGLLGLQMPATTLGFFFFFFLIGVLGIELPAPDFGFCPLLTCFTPSFSYQNCSSNFFSHSHAPLPLWEPLSLIRVVCMGMGRQLFTGILTAYQWLHHCRKLLSLSTPPPLYCASSH